MADERPLSRTRMKKAMRELQVLGERLVDLPDDRIANTAIPEPLRRAIREARGITSREARRRQMQYIGRLMREIDPAPIRAMLEAMDAQRLREAAFFHQADRWREALISGDKATLDLLQRRFPQADWPRLMGWVDMARRAPGSQAGKGAARFLFRVLLGLLSEATSDTGERGCVR